jgi:hypothetical protein
MGRLMGHPLSRFSQSSSQENPHRALSSFLPSALPALCPQVCNRLLQLSSQHLHPNSIIASGPARLPCDLNGIDQKLKLGAREIQGYHLTSLMRKSFLEQNMNKLQFESSWTLNSG